MAPFDVAKISELGYFANPSNPNEIYRLYVDETFLPAPVLTFLDQDWNLLSFVFGFFAADIDVTTVASSDICLINDNGLNSNRLFPNKIYRMYFAKRPIEYTTGEDSFTAECNLLIINEDFTIQYAFPMFDIAPPLVISKLSTAISYDFGLNAEAAKPNYIWHFYYDSDFPNPFNPGTIPAFMLVNQDFEVECIMAFSEFPFIPLGAEARGSSEIADNPYGVIPTKAEIAQAQGMTINR